MLAVEVVSPRGPGKVGNGGRSVPGYGGQSWPVMISLWDLFMSLSWRTVSEVLSLRAERSIVIASEAKQTPTWNPLPSVIASGSEPAHDAFPITAAKLGQRKT